MFLIPLLAKAYDIELNGIFYNLNAETLTAEVTDADHIGSYSGNVTIPEKIKSQGATYTVTSIKKGAFNFSTSLISLTLANSITKIGSSAFAYCYNLENIHLPDNLIDLGGSTFTLCKKLKSIVIPDGVTEIKNGVFSECNSLVSAKLPKYLKIIEVDAFYGCSSLTEIEIPNTVEYIGGSAFCLCESLKTITFPEGLQILNSSVCFGCVKLESVILPSTLKTIKQDPFTICESLKQVICYASTIPEISKDLFDKQYAIFDGVNLANATLYVPSLSIDDYKISSPWSNFGTILPIENYTHIESVKYNTTKTHNIYNLHGKQTDKLQKGINIVRLSNGETRKIVIK